MSWLIRLFLFIASLFSAYEVGHTIATTEQIEKPQERPAVIYQEPERPKPKRAEYAEEQQPNRTPECGQCRDRIVYQPVPVIVQVTLLPRPEYRAPVTSPRPVFVAPAPRFIVQPRPNPVHITRYLHR